MENIKIKQSLSPYKPELHSDGSVSYYNVHYGIWFLRDDHIPQNELDLMEDEDRKRVIKHLKRRNND